jgi:HD-like signal output (HDOD) protein
MKRILFVDDEPRILEGLRRMLHGQRAQWDMVFVASGEAALAALGSAPFDVIVSDMRMPGIDGATLLTRVQEKFPNVVRMVLSGHTELEAALRAVPVAHHFLTKPCDAATLRGAVERACDLQALLGTESIQRIVGETKSLPTLPRVYAALTRTLADPDVSLRAVARLIEQDMAMCAKTLQIVNSGFFGLPRRITNIETAIGFLGTNMLKNLVLTVEVFQPFENAPDLGGFSFDRLQGHALAAARIAGRLLPDKREAEDAFMAAMLHDVGWLILATRRPDEFARLQASLGVVGRSIDALEAETFGAVTHAEIGAYLLGIWSLPYPIVEAVANHHAPWRVRQDRLDTLAAVYVADRLATEQSSSGAGTSWEDGAAIDLGYLETLGVAGELAGWRAIASEQAGSPAAA